MFYFLFYLLKKNLILFCVDTIASRTRLTEGRQELEVGECYAQGSELSLEKFSGKNGHFFTLSS